MKRLADADRRLRPPQLSPASEGSAAAATEWVAVKSADVHRNNRYGGSIENPLITPLEGSNGAVPRDEAFREYCHQFTGSQFRVRGSQRADYCLWRRGVDRDRAQKAEEIAKQRHLVDRLPHEEPHHSGRCVSHQNRIGVRDVIGNEKRSPGSRNVSGAFYANAKQQSRHAPQNETHELGGNQSFPLHFGKAIL